MRELGPLPREFDPRTTRVWHNNKILDLNGCSRFFIYEGPIIGDPVPRRRIEFVCDDGATRTFRLDKEPFAIELVPVQPITTT